MKYLFVVIFVVVSFASCKKAQYNKIIGKYSTTYTVSYGGPYCYDPTEYTYDTLSVTEGNRIKFIDTDFSIDDDGNIEENDYWTGWFRNDSLYLYHLNHSLACNIVFKYSGYKISDNP